MLWQKASTDILFREYSRIIWHGNIGDRIWLVCTDWAPCGDLVSHFESVVNPFTVKFSFKASSGIYMFILRFQTLSRTKNGIRNLGWGIVFYVSVACMICTVAKHGKVLLSFFIFSDKTSSHNINSSQSVFIVRHIELWCLLTHVDRKPKLPEFKLKRVSVHSFLLIEVWRHISLGSESCFDKKRKHGSDVRRRCVKLIVPMRKKQFSTNVLCNKYIYTQFSDSMSSKFNTCVISIYTYMPSVWDFVWQHCFLRLSSSTMTSSWTSTS